MKRLALTLCALLAACGTPQEQCINRSNRDLRTVDRLIAETEANLARGYALETFTVYETQWTWCHSRSKAGEPPRPPHMCLDREPVTKTRPKAIDLQEETRKLAGLKAKRKELARAAQPVIAQCKAQYPE